MFSLEVETEGERKELLGAELWEAGSTGIVETDLAADRFLLRAFFEDEADVEALTSRFGGRVEQYPERDWVEVSRSGWRPIEVGARFFLVPDWMDDPAPAGRMRIAINPGLACGTGYHESTQLCLEAMEEYQRPDLTVLDVGAGSGLLCTASAMLGARRVIGCDVDPVAVEIAAAKDLRVFVGTASSIRSGSCDLVLANINAPVCIELSPEFLRCLAPGGRCVASGFEAFELASVEKAFEDCGAKIERVLKKNDWRALVVTRRDSRPVRFGSTPV